MARLRLGLVLALLFSLALAGSASAKTLRILEYNIRHAAAENGAPNLSKLGDFLVSQEVDIIGLTEVQIHNPASNFANQASQLASKLGMHAVVGMNANRWPSKHGNVLLTKYPVLDYRREYLPGDGEQRGALFVGLNVDGHRVTVVLTHLAPQPAARGVQAEYLAARLAEIQGPKLLLGDLNAPPSDQNLHPLLSATGPTHPSALATFPSDKPSVRADYILAWPDLQMMSERTVPVALSDHLPLVAEVSFTPQCSPVYRDVRPTSGADLSELPHVDPITSLAIPSASAIRLGFSGVLASIAGQSSFTSAVTLPLGSSTAVYLERSDSIYSASVSRRLASGDLRDVDSYRHEIAQYSLTADAGISGPPSSRNVIAGLNYFVARPDGHARSLRVGLEKESEASLRPQVAVLAQAPLRQRLALRYGVSLDSRQVLTLGLAAEASNGFLWSLDLQRSDDHRLSLKLTVWP